MNAFADNPLQTREDIARAVSQLVDPLEAHRSPGGARLKPSAAGAWFPDISADLEGFARPLWGLAPLAAGSSSTTSEDEYDGWDWFRAGLRNGTNPDHPEYWGPADDYSQKHVETAAIGFALAVAPERIWEPLEPATQERVATYLQQIDDADLHDCNWLFFRVLVHLGLENVGEAYDRELSRATLDRLESFATEDGWYADGPPAESARDYYIPWAMHTYGLIYATLADDRDSDRAERFRERATDFVPQFRHWFREDGAGLPYGRSLTYRFAQSAFWGALAFADCEALPWGELKGLWLRNLQWWADQPMFTDGGVLSVGYRYPTTKISEPYNSPSSPYWALKAFLPLALEAGHPFWQAEPEPLPKLPEQTVQPEPKLLICRDRSADHHYALAAGQSTQYREKYTKFAYSSAFGFGVRGRRPGLEGAGHDSALALSEDGRNYRIREEIDETVVESGVLYSRWSPWGDVSVETWLAAATPWHVRVHRLETERPLKSAEGGFALPKGEADSPARHENRTDDESAWCRTPGGSSGVRDLRSDRAGEAIRQEPNTNVCHPRTVVPTLVGEHGPGVHWLVTVATAASPDGDDQWAEPPRLEAMDPVTILDSNGTEPLRCDR
ncbi:DUF2264 domain-containing protein [Natronolimnobius sp. AArcel1]|uniref:DUF2264 domain-containing protein n=1 Tax=Natronolimnobius sp. AArcel1 TaxID=1679093 RepID=UPI0013EB859F|nr:DUF2264 domain-containing protein [Natronolimnobius sp. AArcel1]NGM67741.1 DUF2264 domain-containing protein [Natronolimnobius sp. AArcel1]